MATRRQGTHTLGLPDAFAPEDSTARTSSRGTGRPNAVDRWIVRQIASKTGQPDVALALWNGEDVHRPSGTCNGRIIFRDRGALYAVIFSPELGFGDAFSAGRIEVEGDLVDVLEGVYRSTDRVSAAAGKRSLLGRLPKAGSNTRAGSRRHIQHHYDLGNDFYRLWLDEEDGIHLRVLRHSGRHAGAGAGCQARPRLPQADAPSRSAGHRSGLWMGFAGPSHGARVRGQGARLQHLQGADRLCVRTCVTRGHGR